MFIRRARSNRNGKTCYTHKLVERIWVNGRFQQKTVLDLGSDWYAPRDIWGQVADRVDGLVNGRQDLPDCPEDVEQASQSIMAQLRERGWSVEGHEGLAAQIDLDTIEISDSRSAGCERLCLKALEDLDLAGVLRETGLTPGDAKIATALIVARMIHPAFERETAQWLQRDSTLPEILSLETERELTSETLRQIGESLLLRRSGLEQALYSREQKLPDLSGATSLLVFLNTYTRGWQKGRSGRREPRVLHRRNSLPVTLALTLGGKGFPCNSRVFPGHVRKAEALASAIDYLESLHGAFSVKPTVVMGAGVVSHAGLALLAERGYDWISLAWGRSPVQSKGALEAGSAKATGHEATAWRILTGENERRLHYNSGQSGQTGKAVLERKREQFEAEIRSLHEGLSIPRRLKSYEKVIEKVVRLRERFALVSQSYEIEVTFREDKPAIASAVSFRRKESSIFAEDHAGACVMRTSHTDWELDRLVQTYRQLQDVESIFRQLNSNIEIYPNRYQNGAWADIRLFTSVLAFHAVHLIRARLLDSGIHLSWEDIRSRLRSWNRITTTAQRIDGRQFFLRQDDRPSPEVAHMVRKAGLELREDRYRVTA